MAEERPEAKAVTLRIAAPSDTEAVYFPLLATYQTYNQLEPISEKDVARKTIAMCNGDGGVAIVAEGPSGIVGSVALEAMKPWWARNFILNEVWFFVTADGREGRYVFDLLVDAALQHREDMSRRLGYDMVLQSGVMSRDRQAAKMRLWRSRFGEPVGGIFWIGGEGHVRQGRNKNR